MCNRIRVKISELILNEKKPLWESSGFTVHLHETDGDEIRERREDVIMKEGDKADLGLDSSTLLSSHVTSISH